MILILVLAVERKQIARIKSKFNFMSFLYQVPKQHQFDNLSPDPG